MYRIVFNQLRGMWMVVAEVVSTRGKLKSSQKRSASKGALPQQAFALTRTAQWALLAFGSMAFVTAQADIVADPGAPASQQPFLTNAANGVPLVNIQTPDSHGLSHNTYQQFDVMQNGVILNNSRTNVQTQLGGWVQGNPNLATGTARTILNEVNSTQPSLLNGFIEVAGSRAQVIVANPAGISCNGCGFINAWRATLTTGTPVFTGGDLSAYRVTGGVIQFLGTGMDTSAMDYTDIISRAVVANAGVWAKTLNVVLGTQQVNVASNGDIGTLTPVAARNEPVPQVALDVAALGGMYAGKIHLIGTELGLGVNNQGVIAATTGELSMNINGQLSNHNSLVAQGNMALKSSSLQNTGEVLSGADMHIDTGDLNNQNKIIAATSLTVNANHISNANALLAAGQDMNMTANQLSGDGRVIAGGNLTANLQQDYLQTTGLMQADGDLSLSSLGAIVNQTSILAGNTLLIQADRLNNSGELSGADTELTIIDTLMNTGLIDGSNTFIQADTLTNQGTGQIFGDHVAIQARRLNNLAQTVNGVSDAATIAARERLELGVSEALVNQSGSMIFSLGELSIGRELDAQHGATGQGDSLVNSDATIEADGNMQLNMASIQNLNAGVTTESVETGTVSYDQFTPRGQGGLYNSQDYPLWQIGNENISWRYGSTYNLPFNFREYWRYIYHGTTFETRVVSSQPAGIIAGGNLTLLGNVTNSDSRIIAGGDLTHSGGSLNNLNTTGDTTTTYRGTAYYYDYDGSGGGFDYDIDSYPYQPAPAVTTTPLPTTQYLANTVTTSNGQVASLNTNTLGNQRPDEVRLNTLTSLYRQTDPGADYLIETSPRFANVGQWLSSDYMLSQLSYDPAYQTKRLGDGFYEQKLVREQINQLTGRRFLSGYSNDQTQYQALMTNGITFATAHQLLPGVALSEAQVAQLTSDIVWLVTKTVTLPDGSTTQALVPQVYTRLTAGDLSNTGSLISGQTLNINLNTAQSGQNILINSGTLSGQQALSIQADNIQNLLGQITGKTVSLKAQQDILNQGGSIRAQQALTLNAGNDIQVESTTFNSNNSAQTGLQRGTLGYSERTGIDRVAGLYVTDSANGVLVAMAGGNIKLDAAQITNNSTNGVTALTAGNNIDLTTQNTGLSTSAGAAKNYIKRSTTEEVGTQINTAGDMQLQAGNKLEMRAANITSEQGSISAQASEIDIKAGKATLDSDQYRKTSKSGFMSSSKTQRRDTEHDETAIGSNISGEKVILQANGSGQGNIAVQGSNIVSTSGTTLQADGDIAITSATNTQSETHSKEVKKSGFGASGTSIGYSKSKLNQNVDSTSTTQTASTVGSVEGDVVIEAGKTYTQTASDVIAPQGDIDITAQKVDITSAANSSKQTTETKYKQSGISLSISNPVINAIQTVNQMKEAASNTSDSRMQALAAGTAALSGKNAYDAVKSGMASSGTNAAQQAGGVNISLSIGTSKSSSTSTQTTTTAQGSQVTAGQNISITATGAGEQSDITVIGSQIKAGENATLKADDQVNLLAAKNTDTLNSKNKGSSASVGIGFSVGGSQNGFTLQAGVSGNKGKTDGSDTTWTETQVEAGNKATLQSGTDTSLIGAQVRGKQVVADVGTSGQGNLNVESLQDTSAYKSKQSSAGISAGICVPPFCAGASGGSVSASNSKINSDYASVNEQSGIYAGDGGFQVNVNGDTDLKGAVIASTDKAIQDNKNSLTTNTLTTSNIENKAEYKASSTSLGAGYGSVGKNQQGQASSGGDRVPGTTLPSLGGFSATVPVAMKASDDASSTTVSAISGGSVTIQDNVVQQSKTGKDATTTIATLNRDVHVDDQGSAVDRQGNSTAATVTPIFDAEKRKEISAAFEIVHAFTNESSTFLANRVKESTEAQTKLEAELKKPEGTRNLAVIEQSVKVLQDNQIWDVGSTGRIALTAITGALSGNVTGTTSNLLQNATLFSLQSLGAQQIKNMADALGGEGSAAHTALHAILACGGASAAGSDCGTAALASSAGVVINTLLDGVEGKTAINLTPAEKEARARLLNTIITGTTATLGGDAATAQIASQIETENNALFLAIPAVEVAIDGAIAGTAAAVRYCATNPVCRQKAAELGIKSVATVAVAMGIDVASNHPEGKPITPIVTPPMITPIEAKKEYGLPPFGNPEEMASWVDKVLIGYPAEDVNKWLDDFVKIYPAGEQQSIKDQILLSVQENKAYHDEKVADVKSELRSQGYDVSNREVSFRSAAGNGRTRPDIFAVSQDGKIKLIEVKTGSADLSIRQTEIYPQIANGDSIPVGEVARRLGLRPIPLKEQNYPDGIPIEVRNFTGRTK
ncbi:hemagglutinin repeat-containing protein [Methylophilus sp. QUAN]|nr:hemagglutinin repeat-containing protein [Methylophilus sp. QUAN]MBF4992209.1 hemagglutinin repeat-containing protein [Methylophilus sp. QUAN]